jgi:hypothetical protein
VLAYTRADALFLTALGSTLITARLLA